MAASQASWGIMNRKVTCVYAIVLSRWHCSGTSFVEALAFLWMKALVKVKSVGIGNFWAMGRRGVNFKANVSGLRRFCSWLLFLLSWAMTSIYILKTPKAKHLIHISLLSSRPGPYIKPAGCLHLDISWAPQTVLLAVLKLSTEKGAIFLYNSCSKAPEWFIKLWPQALIPFPSSNCIVSWDL